MRKIRPLPVAQEQRPVVELEVADQLLCQASVQVGYAVGVHQRQDQSPHTLERGLVVPGVGDQRVKTLAQRLVAFAQSGDLTIRQGDDAVAGRRRFQTWKQFRTAGKEIVVVGEKRRYRLFVDERRIG